MLTTTFSSNSIINLQQDNLLVEDDRYSYYLTKAKKHYDALCNKYNLEYRPYQAEMAAVYALRGNNICAGSCGLGKTFIAGLLICIIYEQLDKVGQVQIAVPNKLSGSTRWLIDLNRLDHLADKIDFIDSEKDILTSTKPIWIYTLDFLKRKSRHLKGKRNTVDRFMKRRGFIPSLLIIDEIHLLKPNSDRSKHWQWWRKHCKRFLALSATLSDGRLELLIHIAKLVYGRQIEYSKESFLSKFSTNLAVKTNYIRGEETVENVSTRYLPHLDITKLPEYAVFSQQYINRVSLNDPNVIDVVKIPNYVEYEESIVPTLKHREYYHNIFKQVKDRLETVKEANWTVALNVINPLIRASSFCPEGVVNNKLNKLLTLVEKCQGKTVVFVNSIETGRILHSKFKELYSINAIRLYAQDKECRPKVLSTEQREGLVCRFLFDPHVKVGIFSINLASESIDLNSAEQVIFYDYPWQSIKIQQAIYRAVRPGSPVSLVKVYYLYNAGMIDTHQFNLLSKRKESTKVMLDFDPTSLSETDLSVIDTTKLIEQTLATEDILEQLLMNN